MVYVLSSLELVLGYVSVLSQMKQLVVQDFTRRIFLLIYITFALCQYLNFYIVSVECVIRKSFSSSSTTGHNTLYHICMKTAFIVVL